MRITIIPADNCITIDGDSRFPVGAEYPTGVHAIQWYGDHGFIEHLQGPQEHFNDEAQLQAFVALHAAKKATDETPAPVDPAKALTSVVQGALDAQAQARGYDSILSACSYAALPSGAPFQAEGAAFLSWRSAVWTTAYSILAEVQAGTRPLPTVEQALAAMPTLSFE